MILVRRETPVRRKGTVSDVTQEPMGEEDAPLTPEEAEAVKSFDVRTIGIEPMTAPIPTIIAKVKNLVTKIRTHNEAAKKQKDDPKDPVVIVRAAIKSAKDSENGKKVAASISEGVAAAAASLWESLPLDNLMTASVFVDSLKALVSDAEDNFTYYFDRAVQKEKDSAGITVSANEQILLDKLAAEKLKSLILSRINILESCGEDTSEFFKVSDGGRKALDLPKIPSVSGEVVAPKPYLAARLSFSWAVEGGDGVPVQVDPSFTLNDVAHNIVSSPTFRITGARIAEMLKKEGHGIGATEKEWSLTFPTGTLFGQKVSE